MLMRRIVFLLALACLAGGVHAQTTAAQPAAAAPATSAITAPSTAASATAAAPVASAGASAAPAGASASAGLPIEPEMAIVEALQTILKGYTFNKRLLTMNQGDHWLLFSRGNTDVALVGWTTSNATDRLALAPANDMPFAIYSYNGQLLGTVNTVEQQIGMRLSREPKVLFPTAPNALLLIAARAQTVPGEIRVKGPQTVELTCEFHNPTGQILLMPVPDMNRSIAVQPGGSTTITKTIQVGRSLEPVHTAIGAMGIEQPVTIVVENPLEISVRPEEPRALTLEVLNVGGEAFKGEAVFSLGEGGAPFRFPLEFRLTQRLNTVRIPLGADLPLPALLTVSVEMSTGSAMEKQTFVLARTGALQFVPAMNLSRTNEDGSPAGFKFVQGGDATAVLRGGSQEEVAVPWPDQGTLDIFYDLGTAAQRGEKVWFAVVPENPAAFQLVGEPSEIGFWLFGDNSSNTVRMAWRDGRGVEHFSNPRVLDWQGWRYVNFAIPQGLRAPVQLSALLRVDSKDEVDLRSRQGHLMANGFCFTYGANHARPAYVEQLPASTAPVAPAEVLEPEVIRGAPVRFKNAPQ